VGIALALRGYFTGGTEASGNFRAIHDASDDRVFQFSNAVDTFCSLADFWRPRSTWFCSAVVVRTFSLRRDRDYVTLAILAFLMVLASAVLTVDSIFLFFFAGFTLMAVATFIFDGDETLGTGREVSSATLK